jgi:hypothetical protein
MNSILKKDYQNVTEYYIISTTLLLYLFRTSIPFLKFPFLVLYSLLLVYLIINYRRRIFSALTKFIRNYYLIIILSAILIISFLSSNKIYLTVFKDVINSIILLSFFFLLTLIVNTKNQLDQFVQILVNLIILFALGISLFRLIDLLKIFPGEGNVTLYQIPYNYEVGSSQIDYNFAILPIFFGMVSAIYFLSKSISLSKKLI